jgi:hypothetical protein
MGWGSGGGAQIHTQTHTQLHTRMHAHTGTRAISHSHGHAPAHAYTRGHRHTITHKNTHTHAHTHAHAHAQAHTRFELVRYTFYRHESEATLLPLRMKEAGCRFYRSLCRDCIPTTASATSSISVLLLDLPDASQDASKFPSPATCNF